MSQNNNANKSHWLEHVNQSLPDDEDNSDDIEIETTK